MVSSFTLINLVEHNQNDNDHSLSRIALLPKLGQPMDQVSAKWKQQEGHELGTSKPLKCVLQRRRRDNHPKKKQQDEFTRAPKEQARRTIPLLVINFSRFNRG